MPQRLISIFLRSAGVILIVTGVAKIVSSFGSAGILNQPDPILLVPYRQVFAITGGIEVILAAFLLFRGQNKLKAITLAWLMTTFLAYRLGLSWIGLKYCPCLGNVTDALHISPILADGIMKIMLFYLLMGSYATLFSVRRQRNREAPIPNQSSSVLEG